MTYLHNHNEANYDLADCMQSPKYNQAQSYQIDKLASWF